MAAITLVKSKPTPTTNSEVNTHSLDLGGLGPDNAALDIGSVLALVTAVSPDSLKTLHHLLSEFS